MVQPYHIWDETPQVSAQWRERSPDERLAAVRHALTTLPDAQDLEVVSTTEPREVVVSCHHERGVADEGRLLMTLEAHLRRELGEPVEVYFRERRDENKPRLSREIILDWNRRREEMRAKGEQM